MIASRKGRSIVRLFLVLVAFYTFLAWFPLSPLHSSHQNPSKPIPVPNSQLNSKKALHLHASTARYPVRDFVPLPSAPSPLPRIQHAFPKESRSQRKKRQKRQHAVKEAFLHSWNGYKDHAWLRDEISPESGGFRDTFSGWGATLVDSLDALLIMGLDDEFQLALEGLEQIDFTTTFSESVNVFEIIIRYMGGFLAANDLTNGQYLVLLKKAVELGDVIFNAFDTHNRMPQMRWSWTKSAANEEIFPSERTILAELGSLTVEFTRLTQVTNDPKYFDAVQRISDQLERSQNHTKIPGLWPTFVDANDLNFNGLQFTLGGCADSTYEYLPKAHILLGGQTDQYQSMYSTAMESIKKNLLFRAMIPEEDRQVLFTSDAQGGSRGRYAVQHVQDHLKCFLGGMVGIGSKVFGRDEELSIARGLTEGCVWGYDQMPSGIMPEIFRFHACESIDQCPWDEKEWLEQFHGQAIMSDADLSHARKRAEHQHMPPGFTLVQDPAYKLRPEALESVFIMYRITGDRSLQDTAWRMFQSIDKATRTKYGNSEIFDVRHRVSQKKDKMESFWLAETLKYLYLIFSEPDHISLDEYVLSTEAHPFKRPSGFL
ncbi:Glycoside hydrolase family 47 [Penicillium capsulatum]|uniref:alpha-1,2-Mannosidase n=1 Tax=Penicillium capsulatum TaxID=69766 RepID=A0A9W9IU34_9EURO|nr:Glycoside hydrolase family 47 [Penicillium capsulatum]KAJ6129359.1 Glycoside hydrolase family 47 [Penicillium capsulatum]